MSGRMKKPTRLLWWSAATLWMLMVQAPALTHGSAVNCSNGSCADDEAPCPPDSVPELGPDGGPCVCVLARCVQPVCHYGSQRVLQKTSSDKPGDCCDVYECVQPREKNCSEVVCPEDIECPADSYRLPSHKAPSDCCTVAQGCQCLPGPCLSATCPEGEHAREVRPGTGRPGTCCPLVECLQHDSNETCVLDGKQMKNGSEWWKDDCTLCKCDNGLLFCGSSPSCADISESCPLTRIPAGDCCPVCADELFPSESAPAGCVSASGKIMQNGATWKDDPCTACECVDGSKKCQAFMCQVTCVDPKFVAGECCPRCDATTVVTLPPHCPSFNNNSCSLRCMHGFKRDAAGCYTCQCQAEQCLLECPGGYSQDAQGNKLCKCDTLTAVVPSQPADCPPLTGCRKNCSHGFRLNKAGCEVCKCSQCRSINDCNKNCPHGFKTNDRGCPLCKCQGSLESLLLEDVKKTKASLVDDESICFTTEGESHDVGEVWFDGCRQCYCLAGVEMCNLITCPVVQCKETFFNSSTDCCPRCADVSTSPAVSQQVMLCQSVDGAYRVDGETWHLNPCTKCLCHAGRVLCEAKQCPAAACLHPVTEPGQCCAHCPTTVLPTSGDSCGVDRPHGATWRDGNCRSCMCDSGHVTCYNEECPTAEKCDRPVLGKNWCCSVCVDNSVPKTCEAGNLTYQEDETWNEDACTHCVCQDGAKFCTEIVCSVSCTNPIKNEGKCCPVCPSESSSLVITIYALVTTCVVILLIVALCTVYFARKCRLRRNQSLDINKTKLYTNYPTGTPPPQYASADRRNPYQYKIVHDYDSTQINDMLNSPSIGSPEKMALATV